MSRRELCDQLISMFNLDRIVAAQAASYMDPYNEGVNFATFREFMQVHGSSPLPTNAENLSSRLVLSAIHSETSRIVASHIIADSTSGNP